MIHFHYNNPNCCGVGKKLLPYFAPADVDCPGCLANVECPFKSATRVTLLSKDTSLGGPYQAEISVKCHNEKFTVTIEYDNLKFPAKNCPKLIIYSVFGEYEGQAVCTDAIIIAISALKEHLGIV